MYQSTHFYATRSDLGARQTKASVLYSLFSCRDPTNRLFRSFVIAARTAPKKTKKPAETTTECLSTCATRPFCAEIDYSLSCCFFLHLGRRRRRHRHHWHTLSISWNVGAGTETLPYKLVSIIYLAILQLDACCWKSIVRVCSWHILALVTAPILRGDWMLVYVCCRDRFLVADAVSAVSRQWPQHRDARPSETPFIHLFICLFILI